MAVLDKKTMEETGCPFNIMVGCGYRDACAKCGWNPVVERARKDIIRTERKKKEMLVI